MTQTHTLSGKVAVITGGARGIGKIVTAALVANGAQVVIGDLLVKEGEATVRELNESAGATVAAFLRTDVTKYNDNIALFKLAEKEFGGVDIAFLNAGVASHANTIFEPMDDDIEERIMDINTTAVIKGTKVATLHMAKRGGGVIISTASVSSFAVVPPLSAYNASKFGVMGWTRSFEILPEVCNVRVNSICPFWVETDMVDVIANRERVDPYEKVIQAAPRVQSQTIVDAVLTLITEEHRNCEAMLCLPNGVYRLQEKVPDYPELSTEKYDAAYAKYAKEEGIQFYKEQLEQAMKRYGF
ncbi:hypothetical protein BCR43DRAFT_563794 [Syncephalastrum racemosum]|uniref:Uncharacterized protein n=1 Tax=Syncephalastrum racemosum TaxID=13706 RepID=A0A1X2HCM9_SYNRA|nr:hypothetical protein BCR43DRAFT_563794 [Syncephalastrum racemosum]